MRAGWRARKDLVGNWPTLAVKALAPDSKRSTDFEGVEAGVGVVGGERGGEGVAGLAVGDLAGGEVGDEGAEEGFGLGRRGRGRRGPSAVISGRAPSVAARAAASKGRGEGGAVLADLDQERVGVVGGELAGEGGEVGAGRSAASASRISSRRARAWRSSRTPNWGATPASSGKRRRRASQKAWMVWMRRPPGVSSARAKRVRARARSGGVAVTGSPRAPSAAASVGVGEHRPGAEGAEQAVLHLGGGGLGVGEAEDLLRLGAGEEQARDAVGEHAGLAGAGVGGDPARGRGRRRRGPGRRWRRSLTSSPPGRRRRPIRPCARGGRSRCPR